MISRIIAHVMTGQAAERAPMWLMRQAGRYLPEYRAYRSQFPDFMDFCATREAVVHVTMQPLKRWPLDGAIIFSDILVIPHVLGQKVRFLPDHGPQLDAPNWEDFLEQKLTKDHVKATLGAIADVKASISPTCTLFGFAGAPWTLLRYMFSGSRVGDGKALAAWGYTETGQRVLHHLEDIIVDWLMFQLEAGCDVIQLFDSWAADVPEGDRSYWLWEPVQRIIDRLPPHRMIYFAKGAEKEAAHLKGCALGLGSTVDPVTFQSGHVLQGNLAPERLVLGDFDAEVHRLLQGMAGKPYIFNLGHGVLPNTPVEHVDRLVELLKCT